MSNLNLTLRPLVLLPLVAAMLTACGGGSSSSSSGSSDGGSSTNFNTKFTSSLVITDASGYKTTVRDQSDQSSINDDTFAYTTLSELASNTRTLKFALEGFSSVREPTLTIDFDINTQKILSISYDEDKNSNRAIVYGCSSIANSLCNKATLNYNRDTGTGTVNFSNQLLSSYYNQIVKLNGQLIGKLAKAPVDIFDISKTSLTNISVNGTPVTANSASIIASNSNTNAFHSLISLSNGDLLEIISNNGLFITEINYTNDEGTTYFENLNNAIITSNSNNIVTINLNNISYNNIYLSGNITLQKPKSSLKIDGAIPDFIDNASPILSSYLVGVNNFTLYNISTRPDNIDSNTQTDLFVVANGNTVYAATIDLSDATNNTDSEYACDPSGSQICKGITVSSNGNQLNFNNTVLYRQNGSSMTKSTITVSGSFNTQGR